MQFISSMKPIAFVVLIWFKNTILSITKLPCIVHMVNHIVLNFINEDNFIHAEYNSFELNIPSPKKKLIDVITFINLQTIRSLLSISFMNNVSCTVKLANGYLSHLWKSLKKHPNRTLKLVTSPWKYMEKILPFLEKTVFCQFKMHFNVFWRISILFWKYQLKKTVFFFTYSYFSQIQKKLTKMWKFTPKKKKPPTSPYCQHAISK